MRKLYQLMLFLLLVFTVIEVYPQCTYTPCIPPNQFVTANGPERVIVGSTSYYSLPNGYNRTLWDLNSPGGSIIGSVPGVSTRGNAIGVHWTAPGTYTIYILPHTTCQSPFDMGQPTSKTVIVVNETTIAAPVISGSGEVCSSSTTTYTVPSIAGKSVVWIHGSSKPDPYHNTPSVSIASSSITVTWNACPLSDNFFLAAAYTDGTTTGDFSVRNISTYDPVISGESMELVCLNGTSNYSVTNLPSEQTVSWSLTGGGNLTTTGNDASVTWNTVGNYWLTASVVTSCGTRQALKLLKVSPTPAVPEINGPSSACSGSSTYTIYKENSSDVVQWTLPSGATSSSDLTSTSITVNWGAQGTYPLQVGATNVCGISSNATKNIIVGAPLSNNVGPVTQSISEICLGSSVTYSIPAVSGATQYHWRYGNNQIAATPQSQFTWTPPLGGGYIFVRASNGQCVTDEFSHYGYINDPSFPVSIYNHVADECLNETKTYETFGPYNSTYKWVVSDGVIIGSETSNAVTVQWNALGVHRLSVTVKNPCATKSTYRDVNVINPASSPFIMGINEVCTPDLSTYQVANASLITSWQLTGGGTVSTIPGTPNAATVNWNGTVGNFILRATTAATGCSSATTIELPIATKNSAPPIPVSGNVAGPDKVCQNTSLHYMIVPSPPPGLNYIWKVDNTTLSGSAPTTTVNWNTTGKHYLYVIPTDGNCQSDPIDFIVNENSVKGFLPVTVSPQVTVGTLSISATPVSCGSSTIDFSMSQFNGLISWKKRERSGNKNTNIWSDWSGWSTFGSSVISPFQNKFTNATSNDIQYEFQASVSNASCEIHSNIVTFILDGVPPAVILETNPTVCQGGTVLLTTNTGVGLTYQWEIADWDTDPYNNIIPGATSSSFEAGYHQYRVKLCNNSSSYVSTRLNLVNGGNAIPNKNVCKGESFLISNVSNQGSSGLVSYQWQSSPDATIFTNIPEGTNHSLTTALDNDRYLRKITTSTLNGVGCSVSSNNALVTVVETDGGTIGIQTPNGIANEQIVCLSGNPGKFQELTPPNGTGTISYTWQVSSDNSTFTNISSSNIKELDLNSATATRFYRRQAQANYSGLNCSPKSNAVLVTVSSEVTPVIELDTIPSVCVGTTLSVSYSLISGLIPNEYKIVWATLGVVNWTTLTQGAIPITGLSSTPGTYSGTLYVRNSNINCESQGIPISVKVNARPTVTMTGSGVTICNGNSISIGGNITAVGNWTLTLDNGGGTVTGTGSGAWMKDVSPTTTTTYRIASLVDANCTSIAADLTGSRTVTVKPTPVLSSALTPPAICTGTVFSYTATSTVSGSTITWTRAAVAGITASPNATSGTGNISQTLSSSNLVPTTVAYVYSTTSNGCAGTSTVNVVVNPKPNVTTPDKVICSGQSAAVALTSNVTGSSFTWTLGTQSTITGAVANPSTSATDITEILQNSSTSSGNAKYQVTAKYAGCASPVEEVVVTVNGKITGGQIAAGQTICQGTDPAAFTQTQASTGSGIGYVWQSATNLNGLYSDVSGTTNTTTFNVGTQLDQTTYYQRLTRNTQNGVSCSVNSNRLTVNVNQKPVVLTGPNPVVCSGTTSSHIPYSIASGSHDKYRIDWMSGIPDVPWSNTLIDDYFYANFNGIPSTPGIYYGYLYVKLNTQGCESAPYPVSVTVGPLASISPASSTTICSGEWPNVQLNANPPAGSGHTYQWLLNGVNISSATSSSHTATQFGNYTVRVTNTLTSCFATSSGVQISSGPEYGIITQQGDLCEDGVVILTAGLGHSYQWFQNGFLLNETDVLNVSMPGDYEVYYYAGDCALHASTTVTLAPQYPEQFCMASRRKPDSSSEEIFEESSTLGIYPNPANDEVTIQILERAESQLEVKMISHLGHEVRSSVIEKGQFKTTFDSSSLTEGVYIIVVKSSKGTVMRQKMLIKH